MTKYAFLLAVFLLLACSQSNEPGDTKNAYVEFHLQSQFSGEVVSLLWDHHTIHRDVAVTDNVLSLADIITRDVEDGSHLVTVLVDEHEASQDVRLDEGDSTYFLIRYYSEAVGDIDEGVFIYVQDVAPFYN